MNRAPLLLAITALAVGAFTLGASSARAQNRSLFDEPQAKDTGAALPTAAARTPALPAAGSGSQFQSAEEQDRFIERIQHSDRRATASICAEGCRGEIRGTARQRGPFAALPYLDPVTGLVMDPATGQPIPPLE